LTWRGNWASTNSYALNDAAYDTANGSSYICILAVGTGGGAPHTDATHWSLLASSAAATWGSP
jgi:hypothetical protein